MSNDEQADATVLANKLLDQHWADPDDDLRTLARQFLRAQERSTKLERLLRETYSAEDLGVALAAGDTEGVKHE